MLPAQQKKFKQRCFCLAGLLLLATIFPALYLPDLQLDNRIEVWVPHASSEYAAYTAFRNRFGSDEFILVGIETEDPFAKSSLAIQRSLATRFAMIAGVKRVLSIPEIGKIISDGQDDWQKEMRVSPLLKGLLLGSTAHAVGILIQLYPPEGSTGRRQVVEAVERTVQAVGGAGFRFHLVGSPVMNASLDRMSERSSRLFLPIALALSIFVLIALFRNLVCVVVALLPVVVCIIWTMGLLAMTSRSVNMVTVVLPSLLCVLVLSGAIHLISRYVAMYREDRSPEETMRLILNNLRRPLVISALTTAAGFSALAVSGLDPVRDLGVFAAIGILIGLGCNLILVPMGLLWLYRGSNAAKDREMIWGTRLGRWSSLVRRQTLPITILLCFVCIGGLLRLRFESNVLAFFKPGHSIVKAYSFVGKHLGGFYSVEIIATCPTKRVDDVIAGFTALARRVRRLPFVQRVDHVGTVEAAYERLSLAREAKGEHLSDRAETWFEELASAYHKTENGQSFLRFSLMVTAMKSRDTNQLLQAVRKAAEVSLPRDIHWQVTGIVPLLTAAQVDLVRTQIRSFALAFGLILLMIGILFRSRWAVLSAILPNLLPLALTLAGMGWLNIPLNVATVMIASVALGIAADDTIHFLFRYRQEIKTAESPAQAAERTLTAIGTAVLFTSLVAAAGFGILVFADFLPLAWFGLLTGLTMLTAFAGDVFILPAMVVRIRLWDDHRES